MKKVKELIHQGNIRKITITNKEGKTILVLPLTLGVAEMADIQKTGLYFK